MPETPVAAAPAPSAAPAAPAASAPAPAAPAAPATPAPASSAPAPVAAPTPAAPAAPAKFDPKTSAAPPKNTDYPDTAEGLLDFTRANTEWVQEHPEEAAKLRAQRYGEAEPEPAAPTPEAKTADVVKQAEGEPEKKADVPAAPAAAATPAKLDEWIGKSPELKAVFDANPDLRSEIMEMARANESAKPILDIVGTPEEAQFAVEHANRLIGLQTNWMLTAEDPEMIGTAFEQTREMFKERDKDGKEILGADGKPKMAPDYHHFKRAFSKADIQEFADSAGAQVTALEQKLQGVYPNDQAKEADSEALEDAKYAKAAYDFVLYQLANQAESGSAMPALPPDATPAQKEFQKKLEEERKSLDAQKGKTTTAERKAARAAVRKEVQTHYESGLNSRIENHVKAMKDRGEYLPEFVLTDKWINPATGKVTGLSAFGVKIYQQLTDKINGNPIHRATLANLEVHGESGKEARKAEITRLQDLYVPELIQAEVERIQDGIRAAAGEKKASAATVARVEPQSQGTVVPGAMSSQEVRKWAETEAAKQPGFEAASPMDREAMIISLAMKKRFGS